ncbi:MAG: methyltransferase domain-containing protein [Clostridiales bacterium]|nr:methyltransferase domain-containing protein [Clostridiales bacterium]MDY4172118.1 methyltransferase domain-containing protein [Evtepia sp.]
MESLFCCPICAQGLDRQDSRYLCPQGHSFDRAAAGYVHLLPANKMHSKDPGDDKGMATARNRFLSGDYYAPLRDALAELALAYAPKGADILDAGCGEGYYSAALYRALVQGGKAPKMAGVDLSKHALRRAAKREKAIEFAVASVYDLPVADRQADLLVNCFSPLALEEFLRVLRPGGLYFYVVPGARHLWELKEVLYPNPYPNEEKLTPYRGLRYLEVKEVDGSIHLPDQQTISDLFQMTPYFWKTPKEGAQRLSQLTELDTTISFRIHVFRKEG